MSEEVDKHNIIHETSDYGKFKTLPHNRPLVQSHVRRLVASMSERPHLRPARPVLVNEKNEVVDGQHRLKASEINGQSVYYMMVPGLTIDDARLLNALQRTWGLLDYAYSYASSKVPAYVQFVDTYEAHKLPPSIIMEYMLSGARKTHNFRIGEFKAVDQKVLDVQLDNTEEILTAFPVGARAYTIAAAFRAAQNVKGYDHNRMMNKISKQTLSLQADRVNYIRELERAYNRDIPYDGPSYLRFF